MNSVESVREDARESARARYKRPIPNLLAFLAIGWGLWYAAVHVLGPTAGDPDQIWPYALVFVALVPLLLLVFAVRYEQGRFRFEPLAFRDPVLWFLSPLLAFNAVVGSFGTLAIIAAVVCLMSQASRRT